MAEYLKDILVWRNRTKHLCFDLVVLFQRHLLRTGVTVEEGEEFAAGDGVYNLVYPRQTEVVFRAVFVVIGVMNAHSPLFILFLNKNWVC